MSTQEISANRPTLDERLRYIDLVFECIEEAKKRLIARGEISRREPFQDELPTPRGVKIRKLADQILIAEMKREGLPLSLLPGAASDREAA